MDNKIEVILTDLGGVVYKSTGFRAAISKFLNADPGDPFVQKTVDIFLKAFTNGAEETQLLSEIAKATNKSVEETYRLYDCFAFSINTDYLAFLKHLSKAYRIGILSDNNCVIYNLIRRNIPDFDEIFDPKLVFLSFLENDSKFLGGRRYFQKIVDKTRIDADKILLIDDGSENIHEAAAIKIKALRYLNTANEATDNRRCFDEINLILK